MSAYTVYLANTFEAENPADAVGQMATYAQDNAYQAGYRVVNENTLESVFIDAEDINWGEE